MQSKQFNSSPGYHRKSYAILLRYNGGPYKGWQPHPTLPTAGGLFAAALHRAGVKATPFGASRTDAGVHARAQVASFTSHNELSPYRLTASLNADLPSTMRVLAIRVAAPSFHAHWSSIGKIYRYRISFSGQPSAWRLPACRFPYSSLDSERFSRALVLLKDAPNIGALSKELTPKSRKLDRAELLETDASGLTVEFQAKGFGRYLVRRLVAIALGYSVGAFCEKELTDMLAGVWPNLPRAEPDGLWLHRVIYPPDIDPFLDIEQLVDDN